MSDARSIAFTLKARIGGHEVTPETIGLHMFNRFNRQVEELIAGTGKVVALDEATVSIGPGSYKLLVVLPALVMSHLQPDLHRLERGQSLRDLDDRRAVIIKQWQQRAREEEGFSVEISGNAVGKGSIRVSRETDYHMPDEDEWVAVEKYVVGTVTDIGGVSKANVHLALDGGETLIVSSTEDYLRDQQKNYLYRKVQLHISAKEHLRTGKLKDPSLLAFVGEGPSYNEDELASAIKKGTKAWADVPSASSWVREQRGGYDE